MQKKSGIRLMRRDVLVAVLLLAAVPCIILYGIYGLGDRKYLLTSLLMILCSMLAFTYTLERRNPRARELVTIAVMTAIAVAGRAAFYAIPQFKPVAAIVIISGVCLGPQSGFLVGALAAFVSNFFFGQGPNTPFQMFGFGIIGLLAGFLFSRSPWKRNRVPWKRNRVVLCTYGGLSTLILYGGTVNLGSLLITGLPFTWPSYLAFCAAGLPFDLIHAAASVVFLFFLSHPMMKKLERMKTKYGILDKEGDW